MTTRPGYADALYARQDANVVEGARPASASARRWAVWTEQEAAGTQACFATPLRLTCAKLDCPWRAECMKLRADWMR
ncbi:MAG: hypothetical protein LLF91_03865 [Xanthomonadaceae bacterium]|nr:hypothetical protein [Xanthomonadaceae bacterium]